MARTWEQCVALAVAVSLLVVGRAAQPVKQQRPEVLLRLCRDTEARNNTRYREMYDKVVETMQDPMASEGKAAAEMGDPPEQIHVLAQCMGDLSRNQCSQCFDKIKPIMSGCFPATGGRIFYWGCYIRVENYSFFNIPIEPDDFKLSRCGEGVSKEPRFNETVRKAMKDLVGSTVEKGYAIEFKKSGDVYSVVMGVCWSTLEKDLCRVCMENAIHRCGACLPYSECRLLNSGCAMRYADYDFSANSQSRLAKEIIKIYITYVFGGLGVSAFIVAVGIYLSRVSYKRRIRRRKKNGVKRVHMNFKASEKGLNFLEFNYSTLEKATECFAESHRLGQGGYGEVFKGTLPDGREIAIKRLCGTGGKSLCEEITNEIDIISRAQHKNLVRFLGCCFTNTNSFLIYEFLVNKSLDRIIFDSEKKKELDWRKRWQIILGTAEGLEYLHKGCQLRIIHRDIKASNVLLDAKWRPKIADFGLARFSSCGQNISSATIAGTFGYLAPEYLAQGRLTEKVDVYSFGVLLLEIVSGVRNNKLWSDSSFETLVSYVWKKFQSDTVSDIIEKDLEVQETYSEKEVKRVIQVGLLCTQESPDLRPNMTMVINMLKEDYDTELPMPTKPPFIDEHLEFSSSLGSFRWQPSLGLKL